ncbi:hypothetical protein GCM10009745_53860 [Kribbella yunnanensis]|uniref:Uncharacterized protein n=1 Tax=Kribbella yunnanensis TaxID=190194 RepID=A0ABN2I839_9ACTN
MLQIRRGAAKAATPGHRGLIPPQTALGRNNDGIGGWIRPEPVWGGAVSGDVWRGAGNGRWGLNRLVFWD